VQELEDRFGAVSCETQIIQGRWRSEGKAFRDDLMRIYVDAEHNAEVQVFSPDSRRDSKRASSNSTFG